MNEKPSIDDAVLAARLNIVKGANCVLLKFVPAPLKEGDPLPDPLPTIVMPDDQYAQFLRLLQSAASGGPPQTAEGTFQGPKTH